jgi:hypothetical protein
VQCDELTLWREFEDGATNSIRAERAIAVKRRSPVKITIRSRDYAARIVAVGCCVELVQLVEFSRTRDLKQSTGRVGAAIRPAIDIAVGADY